MLYQMYALVVKELKVILQDRGAAVVLFLLPIIFIFVMTSAGSGGIVQDDNPAEILVVDEDGGPVAAALIAALAEMDGMTPWPVLVGETLTRPAAEAEVAAQNYPLAVVLPAGLSDAVLQPAGGATELTFIVDPALDSRYLGALQGSVAGAAQQVVTVAAVGPERTGAAVSFRRVAPAGYSQRYPTAAQQNVPAYTIFGVFFIVQVMATSLLGEKQAGTFRRLLVAPMGRATLLAGKLLPYLFINLVQVVLMFAVGVVALELTLGASPLGLLLVTLATALAATGLGLLLAALGRSREQVDGLAVLLSIVLAALGGVFIPVFAMGPAMQQVARLTPHTWALTAYQDLIVRELDVTAVLPEIGVLLAFATLFFAVSLWRFRFDG